MKTVLQGSVSKPLLYTVFTILLIVLFVSLLFTLQMWSTGFGQTFFATIISGRTVKDISTESEPVKTNLA